MTINQSGGKGIGWHRSKSSKGPVKVAGAFGRRVRSGRKETVSFPSMPETAPQLKSPVRENQSVTIDRGAIDIGEAFLRKAKEEAELRGVPLRQVVTEIKNSYIRSLCITVRGAEILAEKLGKGIKDIDSIDVIKGRTPDGNPTEYLKPHYSNLPETAK